MSFNLSDITNNASLTEDPREHTQYKINLKPANIEAVKATQYSAAASINMAGRIYIHGDCIGDHCR
jgi:hypothetical protein